MPEDWDDTKWEIFDRLKPVVVDFLAVRSDQVTRDASYVGDLGASDVDVHELLAASEEIFDIDMPAGKFKEIKTVRDHVNVIYSCKFGN